MSDLLSIEGLTISLPAGGDVRTVVRDVALTVGASEALGLVGESGSGKSMTLRAVMRLLPAGARTFGAARLDGNDILQMSAAALRQFRRHDIAMVHQDPAAFMNPVRTVGDFLTEQMRMCEGARRKDANLRAVELLDRVSIRRPEMVLRRYPHELSGGMLQRVMISAALASSPRLLLADEPTTALDVTTQAEVIAILDVLRKEQGLALVFVTHDLDLAGAICDRIAVMYAGSIVEVQTAAGLLHAARHPYSRGLLSCRPRADRAVRRLPVLPGRAAAAFETGTGCAFESRCPHRTDGCLTERPVLRDVADVLVACTRAEVLPAVSDFSSEEDR